MAARHGLQVVLRVPVAIKNDSRVCRGEGYAHSPSLGGKHEHKVIRVAVEAIDCRLPIELGGAAV